MYRLLTSSPDFDVDARQGLRYEWLSYWGNGTISDAVTLCRSMGLDSMTVQMRFELLSRVQRMDATSFLNLMGLKATDRRLAFLCNSAGKTALHFIALQLAQIGWNSAGYVDRLQSWIDIGVSVLQNGADLCSLETVESPTWNHHEDFNREDYITHIPSSKDSHQRTPLLAYLRISPGYLLVDRSNVMLRGLRIWAEMVDKSNLDLRVSGKREADLWKFLGIEEVLPTALSTPKPPLLPLYISGLLYGPSPADWSLACYCRRQVEMYKLQPTPGTFETHSRLPSTISWIPVDHESDEGPWTQKVNKLRYTHVGNLKEVEINLAQEPFVRLVNGCQDDTGAVMLLLQRRSRGRNLSRRAHSQPPGISRREVAYCEAQSSDHHLWLGEYHLCPRDLFWRSGCVADENDCIRIGGSYTQVIDLRMCVENVHKTSLSLQQSSLWQWYSFLTAFESCRLEAVQFERAMAGSETEAGHLDYCPSPEGCRAFRVDKLNVPEELRAYHPSYSQWGYEGEEFE